MNNPFSRSLSIRMLTLFVALAALSLLIIAQGFSRGLGSQWRQTISPHLALYTQYIQEDLGYPPRPAIARELADRLPLDIHVYQDGEFVFATGEPDFDVSALRFRQRRPQHRPGPGKPPFDLTFSDDKRRTVLRTRQQDHEIYFILQRQNPGRRRDGYALFGTLLALTLILGVSFWLIRRQLAPIARIQHGVALMSQGRLDHRIAIKGKDDLAQLANSVDAMAARIEAMLDAKRQLLLALSHELRSPLARARLAIELLPQSDHANQLRDDVLEMQHLIDAIIESEKLQQHTALKLEQLEMDTLLEETLAALDTPVSLSVTPGKMTLQADRTRLALLLRNLLHNALLHGRSEPDKPATVAVHCHTEDGLIIVDIDDQGPGIESRHIDALTDAFYRIDESRTRDSGGVGLGLTLAALIVKAHGGSLQFISDPAQRPGTRVRVTLPISPPAANIAPVAPS